MGCKELKKNNRLIYSEELTKVLSMINGIPISISYCGMSSNLIFIMHRENGFMDYYFISPYIDALEILSLIRKLILGLYESSKHIAFEYFDSENISRKLQLVVIN
jgi:hypothetical protein